MTTQKPKKGTKRTPLTPKQYQDRLNDVWAQALALNDEDTTKAIKNKLTGGFMITVTEQALQFGALPTFKDNLQAIRPKFAAKLAGLEKKFKQLSRDVNATRTAPNTGKEQSIAAK